MNPYSDYSLYDSHATQPALVDDPDHHNTGSLFGGAAALDPYASYSNTQQPSLSDASFQQHNLSSVFGGAAALDPYTSYSNMSQNAQNNTGLAGFSGAQHFPPSTYEQLEDVSTWKLDTIREVATDMYQNPGLALFDLQDQCSPASAETSPSSREWNDHADDDGYNDGDEAGAYGVMEHEPLHADLSGGCAGPRRRKLKMHEWPPQSDPEKEKRRKRALRQWHQRQKEQQETQQLQKELRDSMKEVNELRPEAIRLQRRIEMLEQYAAQQGCSAALLRN